MYRLNRIGPWPLVSLETAPNVVGGAAIPTVPLTEVGYFTIEPVARVGLSVRTYVIDAITIPADEGVAIGTKITGQAIFETNQYLASYGGSYVFGSADIGVAVSAVFGRVDLAGQTDGTLGQYALVPVASVNSASANGDVDSGSANGQIVIGDFADEGTRRGLEMFFGFFIQNHAGSAATINRIRITVSMQRYEEDLRSFDPNR